MRKLLLHGLLLSCVALSACDSATPVSPATPDGPVFLLPPEDGGGGGGGGGGGEEGGGGTPTAPQYRMVTSLEHYDGGWFGFTNHFKAIAVFERNVSGSWVRYDTSLSIKCYENNVLRDQDSESSASSLDVDWDRSLFSGLVVRCDYSAMGGAYTDAQTRAFY